MQYHFGYIPNPKETAKFVSALPAQTFAQAAPWSINDEEDSDVFAWRPLTSLIGTPRLHAYHQGSVGSCVGNGTAGGVNITTAADILCRKEPEKWLFRAAADALYAMSRQVSNTLGYQDGSYGSAAADAISKYGVIHMTKYGNIDLSTYSAQRCRDWASQGVPRTILDAATPHKMVQVTLIQNCQQLRSAIRNYYGVNVCSSQGFTSSRSEGGWAAASGTWNHSMYIAGYRGGKRRGFLIVNSWGDDWITGPVWPDDQPYGSFWADWDIVEGMLRSNDTFAYASYQGFIKKETQWDTKW
jgi:hypothetical protein